MEHHCKTCQCQTKTEYICLLCNYKTDDITRVYISKNKKTSLKIYCIECLHKINKYKSEFPYMGVGGGDYPFSFYADFEFNKLIKSYEQSKNENGPSTETIFTYYHSIYKKSIYKK